LPRHHIRTVSPIKKLFQTGQAWWRYFEKHEHEIRSSVVDNVVKMLGCGLQVMGYATHCCSNGECAHSKKVCFSCKSRFCPTCGKKATDQWILKQRQTLPQTRWQHITLTMPSELWELFRLNRGLLKNPSRLAAGIIKKAAANKGILPGIFTALHTFGRDLNWNVHVHLSGTCGGVTANGTKWKSMYFAKAQIVPMWRYAIIDLLRQANGSLVLPEELKALCSTKQAWSNWLNIHYEKQWIVHFAPPSNDRMRNVNYLGRYIKRPPLSQSRLKHYDGKTVAFDYLNHRDGQHRVAVYEHDEFIERLVQHIPDKHFRMINFYGFLANRVRGQWLPKVYELLEQTVEPVKTLRWRDMQKRSFGTDPLLCILCGSPLRFVGITRGKSAAELRQHHQALALAKIVV
jgi:Putative transposase/Transposase zinc-binding domain